MKEQRGIKDRHLRQTDGDKSGSSKVKPSNEAEVSEKHYSVMEILQSPIQLLFAIIAIFTALGIVPFTKAGYDFIIKARNNKPQGYEFPEFKDFWITGVAALVFAPLQIILKNIFKHFYPSICKEQKDKKLQEVKCEKMGMCTYKAIYFVWATTWGYLVLKDQYYMPRYLGGSGDFNKCMDEYPYANHVPELKEYLLITMGYHVGGFITHFIGTK